MTSKKGDPMAVAFLFQRLIAQPRVGMHDAARFDGVSHKRHQACGRGVGDPSHPYPPAAVSLFSRRHRDQSLLLGLPTPHTLFYAAEIRFIYFDRPGEPLPAQPHHRPAQFMQPSPGGLVTSQAQYPLQPQSADAVLLCGHPPYRPKPKHERGVRILEDRPCRHRDLAGATRTSPPDRTQRPSLGGCAMRASKSLRPPKPEQILAAGSLQPEPSLELCDGPRVVLHRPAYYRLRLGESSGYPHSYFSQEFPPDECFLTDLPPQ